ncbi:hypothetical protein KJ819_01040 [Patescibacteria group bacterium]|nr:hypothetical protein [Patescibacteria group bacterium]MBU1500436.1 hypothetical protein [Patescibacteria group bacterium]MBU2080504.1 hypothetical protein [Patescibacteria group bacterium]MBU2123691.1 hypothetical protein [Patescibacteria group bacterium]MBU2194547.1 hypothetical protein [Patescibacteria group bacterium]
MAYSPSTPARKISWITLGIAVLVMLLVAIGIFYLRDTFPANEDSVVEALSTQSDSTEQAAIEGDLEAQSPEQFDQEIDAAFAELEASLAE